MHGKLNYLDFEIAQEKSLNLVNQTAYKEIIPLNEAIREMTHVLFVFLIKSAPHSARSENHFYSENRSL